MNTIKCKTHKFTKFITFLMIFVGISGCFSVLFGAWLAHAGATLPEDIHERLSSALHYQFIHTLVLFVSLLWYQHKPSKFIALASLGFFLGILAFSGSLYLKTWLMLDWLGKAAPFGGSLLALAWLFIAIAGKKFND